MLRKRKNRRYNETNDEEGDGERKFNLLEQIKSDRFEQIKEKHLQELPGEAVTLRMFQKNGFEKPILCTKPDGLDLRVPPKNFLVRDVRDYVGHDRIIDVMDVRTQKNIEMSMKDWCKYYESKNRDRLLNVISLEFSHTDLDELVDSPMIVKLLDWVDLVWPKFLKQSQIESTNTIDKMKYPKVQKYCLMSVKGSYTDFHIDFGGTSVWYHILKGKKIFWMVPPTELNLQTFEEWTLSGMQQDVFFGDTVEECFRVELCAGNTFFIPSGWIHAVYTLEDSLVFGGNFLHSFGIENQLKVSKIEDTTKVPIKFRYPFYTEILWYAVQHYVYCLTNKDHLHRPDLAAEAKEKAKAAELAANALVNLNKAKSNTEIEDETTESEHEEEEEEQEEVSDKKKGNKNKNKKSPKTKRKAPPPPPKRKGRGRPPKSKKPNKRPAPPESSSSTEEDRGDEEDDESTDIDSDNEEFNKPPKKPTTNTCRMTKNSLLRLQYEVEEQQIKKALAKSLIDKKSSPSAQSDNKSATKKKVTSNTTKTDCSPPPPAQAKTTPPKQQKQVTASSTHSSPTEYSGLNLAEIVLSHESNKLNGWSSSGRPQTTWSNPSIEAEGPARIHITKFEVNGLKVLVKYLSKLSGAKKNLPNLIRNSRALLDDCKKLIVEHENDDPELAITGVPITPDLLKPKKTDLNELIGQFFKPTAETEIEQQQAALGNRASPSLKGSSALTMLASSTTMKSKVDSSAAMPNVTASLTSSPSRKANYDHSASESAAKLGTSDKKSCINNNNNNNNNHSSNNHNASPSANEQATTTKVSSASSSPHKETKCLSPSKKLSSAMASATTSSPPPRPRSPPTRPLSINQYTSKIKKENNLLLPGSFADLIAATSTEKKVFDVSGADVASSLFGNIKDLASTKSSSSGKSTTSSAAALHNRSRQRSVSSSSSSSGCGNQANRLSNKSSESNNSGASGAANALAGASGSSHKSASTMESSLPQSMAATSSAGTIKEQQQHTHPHHHHQATKTNISPEPPKVNPLAQKRFINPHSRPQNKEKLIFASAPYISPVNAADQSRSMNSYPWQTPAHQPQHQQQQHLPPPQPPPPSTYCPTPVANPPRTSLHSALQATDKPAPPQAAAASSSAPIPEVSSKSVISEPKSNAVTPPTAPPSVPPIPPTPNTTKKPPAKPRGPPKKSKEARQAIEGGGPATQQQAALQQAPQQQQMFLSSVPSSILRVGTSTGSLPTTAYLVTSASNTNPGQLPLATTAVAAAPLPAAAPTSAQANKTKAKRQSKKQKEAAATAAAASLATTQPILTTMTTNQARPSVICGLVRPIVSQQQQQQQQQQPQQQTSSSNAPPAAGSKLNAQSYIISRPLFSYNSLPTFSAAQFQQLQQQQHQQQQHLQQRPLNLLTTPMSSSLQGLPLQQGARLVWATQPRKLTPQVGTTPNPAPSRHPLTDPTVTATTTTSSTATKNPSASSSASPRLPPVSAVDNAALLSLATTALSTAPMATSPALSHLSNRTSGPQAAAAAAAAAAAQQQALFAAAGQQYFRPLMQGMPMTTHFVARPPGVSSISGAGAGVGATGPRPSGQLVFARLPHNQGQPRYLITQPGFMQQRFATTASHIVTSQPTSTLAFATFKPQTEQPKPMKTKKLKTS